MAKKTPVAVQEQGTDILVVDTVAVVPIEPVEVVAVAMVEQQHTQEVLQSFAECIFRVDVLDVGNRLTKGGKVRDTVDLRLWIESKPTYMICIVTYDKVIYSVAVYDFDGGLLYDSPKSSIADVVAWVMTDNKIDQGMAIGLKKMVMATRKQALATLPKLEMVQVCEQL